MGKHTHYFATYADAYNYYPNGIPSTDIAIVGDASYVFVSSDNSYSGNTTFFDANMTNDEIVDTMNETAYNAGTTYGYKVGFDEGYDDGYDEGFADGVDSVPTPEGNIDITTTSQYDVTTYSTAQVTDMNLTANNIKSGVTILGVTGSYTGGGAGSIDYAMANQASHYVNATNMISISGHSFMSAMQSYYNFSTSDGIWNVISDAMQSQTSGAVNYVIMADKITSNNGVEIAYTTGGEVSLTGNTITFDVNLNAGDQIGFSVLNWFFEQDPSWMPDPEFPDDPPVGSYVCDSFYWLTGATSGTGTSYPNGHWLTATGYSGTWEAEWNVGAGTFSFSYIGSSEPVIPDGYTTCSTCGGTGTITDPESGEPVMCATCGGTGWLP